MTANAMTTVVLLNLGHGSLHRGFPLVTAQIRPAEYSQKVQLTGSLPPNPDLLACYQRWQLLYELLYKVRSIGLRQESDESDAEAILIEDADVTHVSKTEFFQVCIELRRQVDYWLDTEGFRPLERQLRMRLHPRQIIRFILQTGDSQARRLPWYIWSFFQDYPQAEVALSPLNFAPTLKRQTYADSMRILAVLGDASGIDVEADRRLLEALPDTHVCFLAEPKRAEFDRHLWDRQGWDMLFFAGHSASHSHDEMGQIFLNPTERLAIPQLHNALVRAIDRGLHLAIFNSCEGLGLASQLADLNIPEIIVMREPVPDQVAQIFLKNFLTAFATGQPLYLSVREARERLQGIEGDYPGASWLPVMFQNPAVEPLVWKSPPNSSSVQSVSPVDIDRADAPTSASPLITCNWRWQDITQQLGFIFKSGMLVTTLVMGGRWLGFWQPVELWTYDVLLSLRPAESVDERFLVVMIDSSDKTYQEEQGMVLQGSLADQALADLIATLKPYNPAVIGLDIYRDYQGLQVADIVARARANRLRDQSFVDICQISGGESHSDEIAPPPNVPIENVGFSDLALDPDLVVRRQIFGMSPGKSCNTQFSFSFQVSRRYLERQGYGFSAVTSKGQLQIGSARFQQINAHSGGYHRLETGGFEVLTNYRAGQFPFHTVSLKDLLADPEAHALSELVSGKIVLIGNVDRGDKDYHQTPYSRNTVTISELPGVIIHAHMISALLSATLDGRPTLTWWPQWGDTLWVWGWSVISGVVFYSFRERRLCLFLGTGIILAGLTGINFLGLWLLGWWLPLVPSLLASLAVFLLILHNASLSKPRDQ